MKAKTFVAFLLLFVVGGAFVTAAAKPKAPATDDSIYDLVRRKLADDPLVKGGAFVVEVKDGAVTLRGKVELGKQKNHATRLAKKVRGVKSVDNQLTVVGKGGR